MKGKVEARFVGGDGEGEDTNKQENCGWQQRRDLGLILKPIKKQQQQDLIYSLCFFVSLFIFFVLLWV